VYAITIRAPWAQMFFDSDKPVENRSWPLPAKMLGETIAIHVSVNSTDWRGFAWLDSWMPTYDTRYPHFQKIAKYVAEHGGAVWAKNRPPEGGLIIGTARVVGHVRAMVEVGTGHIVKSQVLSSLDVDYATRAAAGPWLSGEYGHVYSDAKRLAVPVGPVVGKLSYWTLDKATDAQVRAAMVGK
jgi:hypothetical protein